MIEYSQYTKLLADDGIQLTSLGLDEVALTKKNAMRALDIFVDKKTPVLGGDVYFLKNGRLSSAYANWYTERSPEETISSYAERTWVESREYIRNFVEPPDTAALFVFVLGSGD
jgi:hypothetical protein